ncbi:N-acetylmuramoyl-L-alanine amidase [Microbispora amethystogenes]|uniref:peptidoglycan recognition protein family protein n=1 Tax=Microbispora amethystogenes TaxID=1427754 RepID=UPI0033F872E1
MAIDLVTRAEWGARAPRGAYSPLASTRGIKIHYTGGHVDPRIVDDHARCVTAVKGIQNGHMNGNGWLDIGYSMVACPHRKVFVGRGPLHLPAANGPGLNSGHYAVLGLVGNSGLVEPPDDMLNAILDAIDYLRAKGGAGKEIRGHRDGYPTDCPGTALYAWVKKGAPRPGGKPDPKPEPAPAPPFPGRLMQYPPMTEGEDVRDWQTQMRRRGWDLSADGQYGPRSEHVCTAFQREKQLDVDGIVGKDTWKATFTAPIT